MSDACREGGDGAPVSRVEGAEVDPDEGAVRGSCYRGGEFAFQGVADDRPFRARRRLVLAQQASHRQQGACEYAITGTQGDGRDTNQLEGEAEDEAARDPDVQRLREVG